MAFWPKSFKQILTALLASILVLIVSFLVLSLWSFRAFTTFIETDQRQELVLGRLYERLVSTWFQLGSLRNESFLRGLPIDPVQAQISLDRIASVAAELDEALQDHPRQPQWMIIRSLLASYTTQFAEFNTGMREWQNMMRAESAARIEWKEAFSLRLASLSAILANARREVDRGPSGFDPIPVVSVQRIIQETLREVETNIASHAQMVGEAPPGGLSRSLLAELDSRVEARLRALSGLLPALLPGFLGLSTPGVIHPLAREIERFRTEFSTYRQFVESRRFGRQGLEERLLQLHEGLRTTRSLGADHIVAEADYLWEAITTDADRLLTEVREKFWWRFVFLISSFVLATIGLAWFPALLADPIERLRTRFRQVKPGEPLPPAPPCIVAEFEDLDHSFVDMVSQVNRHIRLQHRYFQTIARIRQIFSSLYEMPSHPGADPTGSLRQPIQRLLDLVGAQIPDLVFAWFFKMGDGRAQPMGDPFGSTTPPPGSPLYPLSAADHVAIATWLAPERALSPIIAEDHDQGSLDSFPLTRWPELPPPLQAGRTLDLGFLAIRTPLLDRLPMRSMAGFLYIVLTPSQGILRAADHLFLSVIVQNLATMLEIAELLVISLKEREMSFQLRIAKEIQESALPTSVPAHPAYDLEARISMASEVGGDFYEFFPFPDGRLGVLIADVSGKNVSAALLTMVLRATLRTLPVPGIAPHLLMNRLNEVMLDLIPDGRFITVVYGLLDPASATFTWSNAGHTPVLSIIGQGNIRQVNVLTFPEVPVGLVPHTYSERRIPFRPGDRLLFYTDGVTDLRNPAGEMFGLDRLLTLLRTGGGFPLSSLIGELDRFRAGTPPPDDQTLLAVRFRPDFLPPPA